jgi:hypothetical protein
MSGLRINCKFSEYARIRIDAKTRPLRHGHATALWVDSIAERSLVEVTIKTLDPHLV